MSILRESGQDIQAVLSRGSVRVLSTDLGVVNAKYQQSARLLRKVVAWSKEGAF